MLQVMACIGVAATMGATAYIVIKTVLAIYSVFERLDQLDTYAKGLDGSRKTLFDNFFRVDDKAEELKKQVENLSARLGQLEYYTHIAPEKMFNKGKK